MKQSYVLSLIFVLWYVISGAQPTLHEENGFHVGNVMHMMVDLSPDLNEGPKGINKTWNFSSLIPYGSISDFTGVDVSLTPYANDFPYATVAMVTMDFNGNDIYSYLSNDGYGYSDWGYESIDQKSVASNPRKILTYPFTYEDSFIDSYAATLTNGTQKGIVEVEADGYGTLILPAGIFYNCLRVREIRKDTITTFSITTTNDTSYKFYVSGFSEALCQVVHHHSSDGLNFSEIYWQDVEPSGISLVNHQQILVSPNPCSETLAVSLPHSDNELKAEVLDVSGKSIGTSYSIKSNTALLHVNTTDLVPGVYFLVVQNRKERYSIQFIKE